MSSAARFVDGTKLGTLEPWLETLRDRGCAGGIILPHRALRHSPSPRKRVAGALLLTAVTFLLWYLSLGFVARVWLEVLEFCRAAVGMAGFTSMVAYELGPFSFEVPYLTFPSGLPTNLLWWIGTALTVVLVAVSLLTPKRYLPAAYFLRVVAFFQATSQVYFALWLHHFPYGGAGYVHGMLIAGLMFVSLVPLVLGFTYHVFDFSLGRKIYLVVIMILHLVVMIPFQYFMHAFVVYHLSLLFMPLMFFIFGLPANVMMFIALFGWGFSWRNKWDVNGGDDRSRLATVAAVVVLLVLTLGVAPAAEGQSLHEVEDELPVVIPEQEPVLERTLTLGAGWDKYVGDSAWNNGQSASASFSRYGKYSYAFDVGRSERFGLVGYGVGARYTRVLDARTSVNAGASTGTSDLYPEYSLGAGITRSVAGNVVSFGVTHEQSKVDIRTNGLHLGLSRWFAHWILSAGGSVHYGSPGKTTSPSVSFGATWYTWRRLYVGAGVNFGRVSYLVRGATDTLVDYDAHGYTLGASYWLDDRSGLNFGYAYGESDFYVSNGYNIGYFRQF